LIMARGNFSTTLYASMSRTQVEFGGPATFGLEVARVDDAYDPTSDPESRGSSFCLGKMIERGCYNYRFPLNEYYLDLHPLLPPDVPLSHADQDLDLRTPADKKHVGVCQMLSCAMGSAYYQVLRVEQGGHVGQSSKFCRHFPKKSQIVLTIGGPVWFRTFDPRDRLHVHDLNEMQTEKVRGSIPSLGDCTQAVVCDMKH
jgi:hypothetical protein